jgi:hypothetical protein
VSVAEKPHDGVCGLISDGNLAADLRALGEHTAACQFDEWVRAERGS